MNEIEHKEALSGEVVGGSKEGSVRNKSRKAGHGLEDIPPWPVMKCDEHAAYQGKQERPPRKYRHVGDYASPAVEANTIQVTLTCI